MTMPTLKQIIGSITGKLAFERTQENFTIIKDAHNALESNLTTHEADNVLYEGVLINGFTGSVKYTKDKHNVVSVILAINKVPTKTVGTIICTLPVGFRPYVSVIVPVVQGNNAPFIASLPFVVNALTGHITLTHENTLSIQESGSDIRGGVSYHAGN